MIDLSPGNLFSRPALALGGLRSLNSAEQEALFGLKLKIDKLQEETDSPLGGNGDLGRIICFVCRRETVSAKGVHFPLRRGMLTGLIKKRV
jgi:hypothetical protein